MISILVVAYNARDLLPPCLDSLLEHPPSCAHEVVCVDNASADGTAAMVRERYPWVRLVESDANLGFAGGNRLAALHATGDLLLLLNPDTIMLPGAVDALAGALLADDRTLVVGAQLLGESGGCAVSWGDFPTLGWALANTAPWHRAGITVRSSVRMAGTCEDLAGVTHVDWVSGASLMLRRTTWDTFGGMDSGYFLYYEETDLCARIKAAGGIVAVVPDARIVHIEGAAVGTQSVRQYVWSTRSLIRFLRRNRGRFAAAAAAHWVFEVNLLLWLASVIAGPLSPRLKERRPRYGALIRVGLGLRTPYDPEVRQ